MILTVDEIKQRILNDRIKAISLDTCIFDTAQNGFEFGLLKRVQQFKGSDITFVLTDIVLREVKVHLLHSTIESQKLVNEALKQSGSSWRIPKEKRRDIAKQIFGDDTPETISRQRVDDFLENTGAVVIKAEDHVAVAELVERYFGAKPPFGCKDSEKHEFPDAMALLALESWAAQNKTAILVISNDGDWKRYCKDSAGLVAIDDLGNALGLFQRESALYTCQLLSEKLLSGDTLGLIPAIEDAISNQDSKFDFDPDAHSSFIIDSEWPEATLEVMGINGIDEQDISLEPIEFGDDYIVVLVKVDIQADVSCDFSFSVQDSIDKDYVSMGSVSESRTEEFVADVLVTLRGPMPHCHEIDDVEIVKQRVDVYFGEIEPDWMNDSSHCEE